ncbi:hypothetical protein HHI36_002354 [Cryptolaemus montrouzieri]|uniref:Uncharacterized protein n=1 Tax=Cryptolaemus montrouzieri TaxID=559131 RepID=A0ABD2PAT9_9CUCU
MSELAAITRYQAESTISMNFYGGKIHDFENKLKNIDLLDVKELDLEVETPKKKNAKIMDDMNALQQQMKMNDIDLIGIPEKRNENICDIMKDLATAINYPSIENSALLL